jgi:hypothetical protein
MSLLIRRIKRLSSPSFRIEFYGKKAIYGSIVWENFYFLIGLEFSLEEFFKNF